jgi:hypothetical protein
MTAAIPRLAWSTSFALAVLAQGLTSALTAAQGAGETTPVTVGNFVRAETDYYFAEKVKSGAFGKFIHNRTIASIDKQRVIRTNRDTIYSSGVFDLEAAPLTIVLPDTGKRFMSMQVISQDHYTIEVVYAPGRYTYTKEKVGARYVYPVIRTLANPEDPRDMTSAHRAQDAIKVEQASIGKFEIPTWDPKSQKKVRDALEVLGSTLPDATGMFGSKTEVNPVNYLIGAAFGWGGNPGSAAVYINVYPKSNDGKTVHKLTVKDVPVDGFWSVSLYNEQGFFQENTLGAYSLNNLTAKPDASGAFVIQFGGCERSTPNCLPTMKGWNYTVRLYRPRKEILDGSWKLPVAQPASQSAPVSFRRM